MPARWIEPRPPSTPLHCEGEVKRGPLLSSNICDGDGALVVLSTGEEVRLRLIGIDAPEFGQTYYRESRKQLVKWIARRTLLLELHGEDKFKRRLALIVVKEGQRLFQVNRNMVLMGRAWALGPMFREEEAWAKKYRVGLWRDGDAVAPWLWRRQNAPKVPPPWTGPVPPCPAVAINAASNDGASAVALDRGQVAGVGVRE